MEESGFIKHTVLKSTWWNPVDYQLESFESKNNFHFDDA